MRRLWKWMIVWMLLALLALPLCAWAEGSPLLQAGHAGRGKSLTLRATDYREDVDWSSSNPTVAKVSRRGVVSARRAGMAVITARTESGAAYSCTVTVTQPVTRVKLPSRLTVERGKTAQLTPSVSPADATDKTLTYISSNPAIATVDENGLVTALMAGRAEITARAQSGKKDSIRVTVTQPVTSLALEQQEATVDRGKRLTLKVSILPLDATSKKLTWTSSNKSVASVSSKGVVSARRAGTAVITARAASGVTCSSTVTVTQPVTKVRLPSRLTLDKGKTAQLTPSISPADATDKALTYISSNPSVAVADENGLVTALSVGRAEITARAQSGRKDSIRITVTQPVTSVSLPQTEAVMDRGERLTLLPTVLPADATDRKLTWTSSNRSVATVSGKGSVSARRAGTAVITATSKSGVTCSCTVTVTQPVTKVRLDTSRLTLSRNNTHELIVRLSPDDANNKTVAFASSNPNIASVDEDGVILGKMAGKATITATAASGKKATVRVTVKSVAVKQVVLDRSYLSMQPGESAQLQAEVLPDNASERGVRYVSGNPAVATVDETGMVRAVAAGRATVSAISTDNAQCLSSCQVTVRGAGDAQGKRLSGVVIGINPGHQKRADTRQDPIAPGSSQTGNRIGSGTTGVKTRVREYEVNLAVAFKLRDLLEAEGATVVMTRTSNDVNITNIERAQMLNEAGVDLALQLHCNASANGNKYNKGIVLFAKPTDAPGLSACEYILRAMVQATGAENRGVKKADGYMSLNWSETPALLVEMGYMTNPDEDVLLSTPSYQDRLAEGMLEGIAAYFGR